MAKLHVIGNDFLSGLDRQVAGDAVRLVVIVFADDVTMDREGGRRRDLNPLALTHGNTTFALVGLPTVTTPMSR
jgi:hypothetical protein